MSGTSSGSAGEDRQERLRGLLREGEPDPVAALRATGGLVGVEGTVVAHGETVTGPMTGEDAVLVEYERGRNEDGRYEPVEGRLEAVPFLVEDDTGRVLVDPGAYGYDDGPLPISPGNTDRFEGDEDGENVRPVEDDPVLPWVHSEAAIRPGDQVYVVGTVSSGPDPDLPTDLRVAPAGPDGGFLVSDLSRTTLATELRPSSRLPRPFWQFALLGLILLVILVGAVTLLLLNFA